MGNNTNEKEEEEETGRQAGRRCGRANGGIIHRLVMEKSLSIRMFG
jgi:hypothetical protein